METLNRPTWVEINLDHLKNNIQEVRRVIDKNSKIAAVIKADGYGHGALMIAETLLENGADQIAVAALNEALELREKFAEVDILVLGYTPKECFEKVVEKDITQTIYSLHHAKLLDKKAQELDKKVKIHLKIDTGMRRLGFHWEDPEVLEVFKLEHIEVEGIYTHFAVADESDKSFTITQFNRFNKLVHLLETNGIEVPVKHVANSAAIIDLPEFSYDMVRPGIMLYGLYPSEEVNKDNVNLKPVMTLKSKIAHVKTIPEDIGISYGLIYKTEDKKTIGTLPIGYADGYTRMLTSKAQVLVGKKRCDVLGRICMDQLMIDLEGTNATVGDEVVLFGDEITIDEVARALGTINYEIVCMISRRVPRVYKKNGEVVAVKDYLINN